jgi:hypothetical protein
MSKAKPGIWPPPTYIATFDDNTVGRISFWSPAGKPVNAANGRRAAGAVFARPDAPLTEEGPHAQKLANAASFFGTYPPRPIVDGYVDHNGTVTRDPHFAPETAALAAPRANWRHIAQAARLALKLGDTAGALALLAAA